MNPFTILSQAPSPSLSSLNEAGEVGASGSAFPGPLSGLGGGCGGRGGTTGPSPSPHKSLFGLALLLLVLTTAACQERASLTALPQVLNASWESYRRHFISPEGRVVVPQRGGGTISEAQAYALLRAVWSGDSDTFARVYGWTRKNLSRCEKYGDCLLAWHWGPQPDGSWGVLD